MTSDKTVVIPLHFERAVAEKRRRVTGRVSVSTVLREHEELVEQTLASESVAIERVPCGRCIDRVPPVREEGDTVIIPVVEEVLTLERRLVLKEEVRVRRVHALKQHRERVRLKVQDVVVTRTPVTNENAAPDERLQPNNMTFRKEK